MKTHTLRFYGCADKPLADEADLNATSWADKVGFAGHPYRTHLHVYQLSWLTLVAVTCHGPIPS